MIKGETRVRLPTGPARYTPRARTRARPAGEYLALMIDRTGEFPIAAIRDDNLHAYVMRSVPLLYAAGADTLSDRPAHVRAGSGLAWASGRLVLVQDDANFLALVDFNTGQCEAIELPAGHAGLRQFDDARGNKQFKYDFEALVSLPAQGLLLAFGSGSSPARESVLVVSDVYDRRATPRVVSAPALYAGLRACTSFSGSELNVEGAALVQGRIRLFGRGNGAVRNGVQPVNATCDIDLEQLLAYLHQPLTTPAPQPTDVRQYQLGHIGDVRLSFTDAVAVDDYILYVAAAEDSPDAVRDGGVTGSVIGVIDTQRATATVRWTPILNADGSTAGIKAEGIAPGSKPGTVFVVIDSDRHDQPSELLEVNVSGFGL